MMIMMVVTTDAIVWISKVAYERPRPPDALVSTTGDSFPSAHSATAAVVAIGLVLVFVPITEHRRRWLSAAAGWAVLMAASRVYLRAHWFTDVVAGVAIGAAVALAFAQAPTRQVQGDQGRRAFLERLHMHASPLHKDPSFLGRLCVYTEWMQGKSPLL